MDKNEKMQKFEEYMKTATIVITGDDFASLTSQIIKEEPFASLIKEDPIVYMTLMLYTASMLHKLLPNPFKEDDESEE